MSCGGCKNLPKPYTHTVTIEKPKATAEVDGQDNLNSDANWTPAWRTRARFVTPTSQNVTTASGMEFNIGNQLLAVAPIAMFVPYSSESRIPSPAYRIRSGEKVYNIIYAERVDRSGPEILIKAIERKTP